MSDTFEQAASVPMEPPKVAATMPPCDQCGAPAIVGYGMGGRYWYACAACRRLDTKAEVPVGHTLRLIHSQLCQQTALLERIAARLEGSTDG